MNCFRNMYLRKSNKINRNRYKEVGVTMAKHNCIKFLNSVALFLLEKSS